MRKILLLMRAIAGITAGSQTAIGTGRLIAAIPIGILISSDFTCPYNGYTVK